MDMPAKILLTTSRNPTPRIRAFCHDLAEVIPHVMYENRGKMNNDGIAEKALEHDATRVIVIDRWQGGPGILRFFKVDESGLFPTPPVIHVEDMKLQRDLGALRVKPAPSIAAATHDRFDDSARLSNALSGFFDISLLETKDMIKTGSTILSVSSSKSGRILMTIIREPDYREVGQRVLISRVEW